MTLRLVANTSTPIWSFGIWALTKKMEWASLERWIVNIDMFRKGVLHKIPNLQHEKEDKQDQAQLKVELTEIKGPFILNDIWTCISNAVSSHTKTAAKKEQINHIYNNKVTSPESTVLTSMRCHKSSSQIVSNEKDIKLGL